MGGRCTVQYRTRQYRTPQNRTVKTFLKKGVYINRDRPDDLNKIKAHEGPRQNQKQKAQEKQ
jgi:hypothetical protein